MQLNSVQKGNKQEQAKNRNTHEAGRDEKNFQVG